VKLEKHRQLKHMCDAQTCSWTQCGEKMKKNVDVNVKIVVY
jgi:hypothetical protein